MKALVLSIFVIASLVMAGCSTKSNLHRAPEATHLAADSKFKIGETVDASGFVFSDPREKFSLSEAMAGSLNSALSMEGLSASNAKYIVKTKVIEYAPGNAFTRWMLPGAGATKLSTECTVYTTDNIEIARIPVQRSIAAGGGYTIDAWKYVFDDVARETVRVIKTQLMVSKG